jgi:hypothetical protein
MAAGCRASPAVHARGEAEIRVAIRGVGGEPRRRVMGVRVVFVDGPEQGRSRDFDDSVDKVTIGRDPDRCDIVFPAEPLLLRSENGKVTESEVAITVPGVGAPYAYAERLNVELEKPGEYLLAAFGGEENDIDLAIAPENNIYSVADYDTEYDWYPYVSLYSDGGEGLVAWVLSVEPDVGYDFVVYYGGE